MCENAKIQLAMSRSDRANQVFMNHTHTHTLYIATYCDCRQGTHASSCRRGLRQQIVRHMRSAGRPQQQHKAEPRDQHGCARAEVVSMQPPSSWAHRRPNAEGAAAISTLHSHSVCSILIITPTGSAVDYDWLRSVQLCADPVFGLVAALQIAR